jgi:hypothetical protein
MPVVAPEPGAGRGEADAVDPEPCELPAAANEAAEKIPLSAAEPMTSRDIALEMLVTRALDKDDQKLLALMTKRVGVTLRLQRVNGIVRSASGPGQYMIWEIAR